MKPRRTEGPRRLASVDPPARAPALPAWKAFAVQFSRETGLRGDVFAGRVEHLSSGRRARFESEQELLAVLRRLLGEIEDVPE